MACRLLGILLLAALVLAPAARAAGPAETRASLARQMRAAGAGSGAYVVDLDSGRRVYARRAATARVPASVNKLFITATTLLRFGGDATLDTLLMADAPIGPDGVLDGNLYLRGGGDPALTTRRLASTAAALVTELGLLRITGRVIGDESRFDERRGPPSSRYAVSGYVGPLSALTVDRGLTGRRRPYFQPAPSLFAARKLARALRREGVATRVKRARTGRVPSSAIELTRTASPPVADLVRRTNAPSDNFIAETLIKNLGADFGRGGSTAAGAAVVRATLRSLGVRARVADGSGLSRSNRVSPREVVDLLDAIEDTAARTAFRRSLAVAGRTGTLAKRMRRTAARRRCRGKTGTLYSVSALAGYCTSRGGARLAFAILQNRVSPYHAKLREDRMLSALAAYDPAG